MKRKNSIGILTIGSFLLLVLLAVIISSKGAMVSAFYVKLALCNFAALVVLSGIYLMDSFCKETLRKFKIAIASYGAFIALLSFFVCFDIIPFHKGWNWLVSGGILYILLIQLQLLNWGRMNKMIVKFSALFVIMANTFLIFFFIAKWRAPEFAAMINLATIVSITFTFIGLFFLRKKVTDATNKSKKI